MIGLLFFIFGLILLCFVVFLMTEYNSRKETIDRNRLRSVAITYDMTPPYFVGPTDLRNITMLINQKLTAPYGESNSWLNKPINTKDIVNITSIPTHTIDRVQIVVWYLHRFRDVVDPKPSAKHVNFNPYRTGF